MLLSPNSSRTSTLREMLLSRCAHRVVPLCKANEYFLETQVDNTTVGNPDDSGFGRASVKMNTTQPFTKGSLVVMDALHLPYGVSLAWAVWLRHTDEIVSAPYGLRTGVKVAQRTRGRHMVRPDDHGHVNHTLTHCRRRDRHRGEREPRTRQPNGLAHGPRLHSRHRHPSHRQDCLQRLLQQYQREPGMYRPNAGKIIRADIRRVSTPPWASRSSLMVLNLGTAEECTRWSGLPREKASRRGSSLAALCLPILRARILIRARGERRLLLGPRVDATRASFSDLRLLSS
jgi:hypothetical protein